MVSKKSILIMVFLILMSLIVNSVFAVNYNVGPGQTYTTLGACLDAINGSSDTCVIAQSGIYSVDNSIYQLNDTAIIVNADNVTVLCNGTTLIGDKDPFEYAISFIRDYVTVDGCIIDSYGTGIYAYGSSPINATIRNNIIYYGYVTGIEIGTKDSLIENNYIDGSKSIVGAKRGFGVTDVNNTIMRNNFIYNSTMGFYMVNSDYSIIEGNIIEGGTAGIAISTSFYNNIVGNTFKNLVSYSIQELVSSTANNTLWNNQFLSGSIVDGGNNYFCNGTDGNFYLEGVTPETGDCGQGVLNNVTPTNTTSVYPISWSRQSAQDTVTYDLFLNHLGGTNYIGSTTGVSTTYNFSGYINQTVNISIIPWINGSRYNGTHIDGESFNVSDVIPSPPGPAPGPLTPAEQCQETQTLVFIGFSLLALMVIVGGAFAIVMMLKGNIDALPLIIMIAGFIGLTIIIFVGYIAIGYVGQWVCF